MKKTLQGLLISLATIVVFILLAEGTFRILSLNKTFRFSYITQKQRKVGLFMYDQNLGWKNRPGFSSSIQWPHRTTSETINSHGWRDKDYGYQKPDGVYRIAVLGCSRTYGYGVNAEEMYTEQLEQMLNASLEKEIEVLNCAVNGYGLSQMVINYFTFVKRYKPDLIILQFYPTSAGRTLYTEMWATQKPTFRLKEKELFLKNHPVPENRFRAFEYQLMDKSIFYRYIKNQLLQLKQARKNKTFNRDHFKTNKQLIELCSEIFKLLKAETDADATRLFVFVWGDDAAWLKNICAQADVEVMNLYDMEDIARWREKGETENPPPVGHWSALGHQFVATALYKYLKQNNVGGLFHEEKQ
ncbi:SGNH/GDSL hydrolase family protein [Candidatus Omnitrophota bacterium]